MTITVCNLAKKTSKSTRKRSEHIPKELKMTYTVVSTNVERKVPNECACYSTHFIHVYIHVEGGFTDKVKE